MSESNEELPQSAPNQIDKKTSEVIDSLAEKVSTPFPLEDLIKIGVMIRGLQDRAERAEEETMTDALTKIPNRRFFDKQLDAAITEAERKGYTFYVAMIDYDNFKSINTAYGHTGGDSALMLVANLPHRKEEPISRYGGDEFAQVISPSSEKELVDIAERYHRELEKKGDALFGKAATLPGQNPVPIGISIGFARYQGESGEELMKKASTAALEAKNRGRGTTVLARSLNGETRFLEIKKSDNVENVDEIAA